MRPSAACARAKPGSCATARSKHASAPGNADSRSSTPSRQACAAGGAAVLCGKPSRAFCIGLEEPASGSIRGMRIAALAGDGIGPEITAATLRVLEVLDAKFDLQLRFERHDAGTSALEAKGNTFPAEVLEACRAADGVLIGPMSHL